MNRLLVFVLSLLSSPYALSCALNNCAATDIVAGQVQSAVGTPAATAVTVQGSPTGTPIPVTASITPPTDYTIASTPITAANANLSSGTPTVGSFAASATMSSVSTASFVVTGTFVATLVVQYSTDTSNWVSLPNIYNVATGVAAANITGVGTYQVPVPASAQVRLTASAYTSGTATVQGRVSSGNSSLVAQAITGTIAATQSGTWTVQPGNTANTTPWLATISQGGNSATVSAGGALKTDGSASTQPISAVSLPLPALASTSTKQSDGTQKTQVVDGSGNVIGSTANALDINVKSGSVTVNAGTNLNTSALALESGGNLAKLPVAQASTTSGQSGPLVQGAVTTAAPSYTTAQTSPFSLDTAGNLRVVTTTSGTGATAANQATEITSLSSINTNQTNGTQQSKITNGTNVADVAAGDSGSNGVVTGSTFKDTSFTTSTNQAVASTDVSAMRYVVVKFSALGGSATNTFQYSDDNSTWFSLSLLSTANLATPTTTGVSTQGTATYSGVVIGKYFRINVTGIASGSTAGYVSFSNTPLGLSQSTGIGGTTAVTQSGTWTVQPGNTPNTTPSLSTITPVVSPLSSSSPNEASVSTAYEASHVVKASAGVLYSLLCYNSKTSTQFLEVFNSTTVPADTTVSVTVPVSCPASSNCTLDFGNYGKYFSTGISWSNSSTSPTKTIGSADMFCEPRYQ